LDDISEELPVSIIRHPDDGDVSFSENQSTSTRLHNTASQQPSSFITCFTADEI
jgi:hypothetical protein